MLKKKKHSRKWLVRNLDKIFSEFIRLRDQKCVLCFSKIDLTCGHIFSRTAYSTRWDEENCHCQCWGHNFSHTYDPYPYLLWFQNKFGKEKLDALHRRYKKIRKISNGELQDMLEVYKGRLSLLKDCNNLKYSLDKTADLYHKTICLK